MKGMAARLAVFLMAPALAGCGGGRTGPQDDMLDQAMETGRQAVALDRLELAEIQYRLAGRRAMARDDAGAIGDAGYDLAVVQLDQGRAADALRTLSATRGAMAVRGWGGPDAALDLVQATALHRLKRDDEAAAPAGRAMGSADPAIAEHAALLSGLIADARGDRAGLSAALEYLARERTAPRRPVTPKWQADEDELRARLLLASDPLRARDLARAAADRRRQIVDYRGMARALVLASHAAARGGDGQGASSLAMQAAQSTAAQGEKPRNVIAQGAVSVTVEGVPAEDAAIAAHGPDPFAEPSPGR